jgi:pimeloyl-ACP methyl ester carboxylesterase
MTRSLPQGTLSNLSPAVAGDAAFRIFCTPSLSDKRGENYRMLSERARFHLRNAVRMRVPTAAGEVQVYVLEPDAAACAGSVLMVHGWSGEAAFMSVLAEPIRRAGFRVVLFDLPAHGLSAGRRTNLVDCAKATLAVAEHLGPVRAVVAHSFGGMIAALAMEGHPPMPGALRVEQLVLIACPNRLSDLTRDFAARWELTQAGRRAFERRLERVGWRSIDHYATARLLGSSGCDALVVHDRGDDDVAFACGEEIVAGYERAELAAFDGFGHRNILFAPPVMRLVARRVASLNVSLAGQTKGTPRRPGIQGQISQVQISQSASAG